MAAAPVLDVTGPQADVANLSARFVVAFAVATTGATSLVAKAHRTASMGGRAPVGTWSIGDGLALTMRQGL
jgi:hypothetical protein